MQHLSEHLKLHQIVDFYQIYLNKMFGLRFLRL